MDTPSDVDALEPFPSPFSQFPDLFSADKIVPIVFFFVFALWFVYTLSAAYHWFRYGHQSWFAVPALALHLFVSGFLALYIMSGIR